MPLPPTNPTTAPQQQNEEAVAAAVGTAGNDLNTDVAVVERTGFVTRARYIPAATLVGQATNYRRHRLLDISQASKVLAEFDSSSRAPTDGVTTLGSTTVTSATAAFTRADVGKTISGTGIPASTKIVSVTSATAVVISNAATATGSGITITIVGGFVADTETDLGLDLADTSVNANDVLQLQSTHIGTGQTDPGGLVLVEVTSYA